MLSKKRVELLLEEFQDRLFELLLIVVIVFHGNNGSFLQAPIFIWSIFYLLTFFRRVHSFFWGIMFLLYLCKVSHYWLSFGNHKFFILSLIFAFFVWRVRGPKDFSLNKSICWLLFFVFLFAGINKLKTEDFISGETLAWFLVSDSRTQMISPYLTNLKYDQLIVNEARVSIKRAMPETFTTDKLLEGYSSSLIEKCKILSFLVIFIELLLAILSILALREGFYVPLMLTFQFFAVPTYMAFPIMGFLLPLLLCLLVLSVQRGYHKYSLFLVLQFLLFPSIYPLFSQDIKVIPAPVPISGEKSYRGDHLKNAWQTFLAMYPDSPFRILPIDTKSDPQFEAAMVKALDSFYDRGLLIYGPSSSEVVDILNGEKYDKIHKTLLHQPVATSVTSWKSVNHFITAENYLTSALESFRDNLSDTQTVIIFVNTQVPYFVKTMISVESWIQSNNVANVKIIKIDQFSNVSQIINTSDHFIKTKEKNKTAIVVLDYGPSRFKMIKNVVFQSSLKFFVYSKWVKAKEWSRYSALKNSVHSYFYHPRFDYTGQLNFSNCRFSDLFFEKYKRTPHFHEAFHFQNFEWIYQSITSKIAERPQKNLQPFRSILGGAHRTDREISNSEAHIFFIDKMGRVQTYTTHPGRDCVPGRAGANG